MTALCMLCGIVLCMPADSSVAHALRAMKPSYTTQGIVSSYHFDEDAMQAVVYIALQHF